MDISGVISETWCQVYRQYEKDDHEGRTYQGETVVAYCKTEELARKYIKKDPYRLHYRSHNVMIFPDGSVCIGHVRKIDEDMIVK